MSANPNLPIRSGEAAGDIHGHEITLIQSVVIFTPTPAFTASGPLRELTGITQKVTPIHTNVGDVHNKLSCNHGVTCVSTCIARFRAHLAVIMVVLVAFLRTHAADLFTNV